MKFSEYEDLATSQTSSKLGTWGQTNSEINFFTFLHVPFLHGLCNLIIDCFSSFFIVVCWLPVFMLLLCLFVCLFVSLMFVMLDYTYLLICRSVGRYGRVRLPYSSRHSRWCVLQSGNGCSSRALYPGTESQHVSWFVCWSSMFMSLFSASTRLEISWTLNSQQ